MATALGVLPSAIDNESVAAVADLIRYWDDQPPTHELVAAFMGFESKRRAAPTEEETRKGLQEASKIIGPASPMPPHIRQMIEQVEELKRTHKGLIGNA